MSSTGEQKAAGAKSFPAYSEYKDSGVEWLGDVPAHWESRRLKDGGKLVAGAAFPHENQYKKELELPFYKVGDLGLSSDGVTMGQPQHTISKEDAHYLRAFIIPKGAIVWAKIGAALMLNRRRLVNFPCCIDNNMTAYIPDVKKASSSWIYYWSNQLDFSQFANPGAVPSLGEGYQKILPLLLPPLQEQKIIAIFLDHETARIDALVAEQQRLIALLKEKRQAVISHAVTKGLDPDAPMKDSGVEWLGDVPAHWELTRIGWITSELTYGFTNPMPTEDDGPKMLTANDIGWGEVFYGTARSTSTLAFKKLLTNKSRPRLGDLLLTKDGTLGRVAVHDGQPACINQSVALIRAFKVANPNFLCSLLQASCYQSQMIFEAGGTTIKHIYITRLSKMSIVLPPLHEQCSILERVDNEDSRYLTLISEAENSTKLLAERRSALISAAVTGKIDVRGWQADRQAESEDTPMAAEPWATYQ